MLHFFLFSATLDFWGKQRKVDVTPTLTAMACLLTKEIQDVRRPQKKAAMLTALTLM